VVTTNSRFLKGVQALRRHVAGAVASPVNGLGMAGVAPNVTLVNIRAGRDSGFFFLEPTINAMEYAGDVGIDVVNMSFYTDPWLYNCGPDHPATDPSTGAPVDSPDAQLEQQAIIDLTQRAVDYARARGVTFVAAAGNEATQSILENTATHHACSSPRLVDYTIVGRRASWNAYCGGGPGFNDFYGHGIVNALAVVGG
jgi:Subtilase family